jgi:DHA1 family multidrug resistance protein-like MFS transporter
MLWLSGFACLVLAFIMPETSSSNILTRRAQRLRKLTGNDKIRSPGEIQGEGMGLKSIAKMTLWMPFFLSL